MYNAKTQQEISESRMCPYLASRHKKNSACEKCDCARAKCHVFRVVLLHTHLESRNSFKNWPQITDF